MSHLGIDLVYSQASEKMGTVNWKLHLVSEFLNCLSNTCPQLELSRTLRSGQHRQPERKVCWDKEWGREGGRASLNVRTGAVISKPSLGTCCVSGHGCTCLKMLLVWPVCVAFYRKLQEPLCQGPAAFKRCCQLLPHQTAGGICHLEYKILTWKSIFLEVSVFWDDKGPFKTN